MSDEPESTEGEAAPKKKGGMIKVIVAVVLGLVVGVGGGSYVLGPLLAKGHAPADTSAAEGGDAKGGHEKKADEHKGGKEGASATLPMHQVDNVVLNPAKSGGTRFLMVSAAFATKNQGVADDLKSHDAEVRDIMLRVLGGKTVEELSDPTLREALKEELKTAIDSMVGSKDGIKKLYFPQFVIQ
ncbi:MAG: flagellar basal body-associated FliL family protein [Gemmatimonadota bacterium]|nr:flagellar basal body-associated FliL family protein [Gemmatimonadota bacterium]